MLPRDARIADLIARLAAAGLVPERREYADRTLIRAPVPDDFAAEAWPEVLAALQEADAFGSAVRAGGGRSVWAAFHRTKRR